jgi:threonine dehydratase
MPGRSAGGGRPGRQRRYGVDVRVMGHEPAETERLARLWATETDMSYISPYNHTEAVARARDLGLIP